LFRCSSWGAFLQFIEERQWTRQDRGRWRHSRAPLQLLHIAPLRGRRAAAVQLKALGSSARGGGYSAGEPAGTQPAGRGTRIVSPAAMMRERAVAAEYPVKRSVVLTIGCIAATDDLLSHELRLGSRSCRQDVTYLRNKKIGLEMENQYEILPEVAVARWRHDTVQS